MNPDKLFDYLDGKLSPEERAALEERFISEPELRKELAVARQIHSQMGDSMEVVGFAEPMPEPHGPLLARRIAIVFMVLVFVNVAFGIYAIGFMKKRENARVSTEKNRTELVDSLARAAAVALPTPSLEVEEIKFIAPITKQNELADTVLAKAKEAGGSATKGLADEHGILIFAEVPSRRLDEFREALKKLGGSEPPPPPSAGEKTILQVRIVSAQ